MNIYNVELALAKIIDSRCGTGLVEGKNYKFNILPAILKKFVTERNIVIPRDMISAKSGRRAKAVYNNISAFVRWVDENKTWIVNHVTKM